MAEKTRGDQIATDLKARYGVVLMPANIAEIAGVRSRSSLGRWFKAAEAKGLRVFRLPGRKGRYVLAQDMAQWLAERAQTQTKEVLAQPAKEGPGAT